MDEIEEWQGGDIVIFHNHVGIVSDHRNKNGVLYVIHHSNPVQDSYEQNILEKYLREIVPAIEVRSMEEAAEAVTQMGQRMLEVKDLKGYEVRSWFIRQQDFS